MTVTHTPGPWATGNTDPLLFGKKIGNGTEPIGFVYGPSFPERSKVGQRALANACLISASPDMYESLKEALEAVKAFHGPDCWEIYWDNAPEMKRARAALAKAEGKS